MNVVTFPIRTRPHVQIESYRVTGGDDPSLIGRWCYFVSFHDGDGIINDYVGTDYAKAGRAAVDWARDYGCKIVDRSTEEPKL